MERVVKCQDNAYHAYPGWLIVVNIIGNRQMKLAATDEIEPNEVIQSVTTEQVDISQAYIMGSRLIIPGYYAIPFSRQNISKKYFKAMFVEWLYDNNDQIAIMLNKDSKKQADKDRYNDMQLVRNAAGDFADKVMAKLNELLAKPQFVPETGTVEVPADVEKILEDNNTCDEAENSESNARE